MDSSVSLFLSPRPYILWFSFLLLFFSLHLACTLGSDPFTPTQPVSSLKPDTGGTRREMGTGTKRNQLKRTRNSSTLLVAVGVGVLMGCDRIDIGFGYSPASRFQEFRCRYGYAFHVIFFWSQNMDLNSHLDSFFPSNFLQSPVDVDTACMIETVYASQFSSLVLM